MVSSDVTWREPSGQLERFGRAISKLAFFAFVLAVIAAIFVGWRLSRFDLVTAERGIGYALGIVGGTAMLLLLVYPLRKRSRRLRAIGSVRLWFRMHMILGIVGPVLILFHANFGLGSLNSNVALFSMLIVSASGLLGRYAYGKIHRGLYGEKENLSRLTEELRGQCESLSSVDVAFRGLAEKMETPFSNESIDATSIFDAARKRRKLRKDCKKIAKTVRQSVKSRHLDRGSLTHISIGVKRYAESARKIGDFIFYERVFALWHLAHIPLFFMLILAAIVHVVAVHAY